MRQILITRIRQDDTTQTLGHSIVYDGVKKIFEFNTLELPWKENKSRISCIPEGRYIVEKFNSPKFGGVFLFNDVKGRSMIEMHTGNYYTDILGCILPGAGLTDINNDGYLDVHSSGKTMEKLLELMPNKFTITINCI